MSLFYHSGFSGANGGNLLARRQLSWASNNPDAVVSPECRIARSTNRHNSAALNGRAVHLSAHPPIALVDLSSAANWQSSHIRSNPRSVATRPGARRATIRSSDTPHNDRRVCGGARCNLCLPWIHWE